MIFVSTAAYYAAAVLAYTEAGLAKARRWLLRVAGGPALEAEAER